MLRKLHPLTQAEGAFSNIFDGKSSKESRINDQWRIVFRWTVRGPEEVRIEDYH